MTADERDNQPRGGQEAKGHDPAVRAAIITTTGVVLAAVVAAAGGFASGWLQYRAPGAELRPSGEVTVTKAPGNTPRSLLGMIPSEGVRLPVGPQTVNTKRYEFTMYAGCDVGKVTYWLDRQYRRFRAMVGVSDRSNPNAHASFTVERDGEEAGSALVAAGTDPQVIDVDITEALRLTITGTTGCQDPGTAVWIDPAVTP